MTKAELEAQVAEQQEWIAELESAVMVFAAFTGAVGVAETRKAEALDIGVSTAKMRTVVDVCEKIDARLAALAVLEGDDDDEAGS